MLVQVFQFSEQARVSNPSNPFTESRIVSKRLEKTCHTKMGGGIDSCLSPERGSTKRLVAFKEVVPPFSMHRKARDAGGAQKGKTKSSFSKHNCLKDAQHCSTHYPGNLPTQRGRRGRLALQCKADLMALASKSTGAILFTLALFGRSDKI